MVTRKSPAASHTANKAAATPASADPSAATGAAAPARAPQRIPVANDAIEFHTPRQKLVRDSFTFSTTEYAVLGELKQRAAHLAQPAKKGEILRAGLAVLDDMSDAAFLAALAAVPSLKSKGRKDGKATAGRAAAKPAFTPILPKPHGG